MGKGDLCMRRVIMVRRVALGLLLATTSAMAQAPADCPEPVRRGVAITPLMETEKFRLSRVVMEPGGDETSHRHCADLLGLYPATVTVRYTDADQNKDTVIAAGSARFLPKGTAHAVSNPTDKTESWLIVELKDHALPKDKVPLTEAAPTGFTFKELLDNEKVRVVLVTMARGAKEQAHVNELDSITMFMVPTDLGYLRDGEVIDRSFRAAGVMPIPRGTEFALSNPSAREQQFVTAYIKDPPPPGH